MNRYNFIAPFYDFLKRLVFGKRLEEASNIFIDTDAEAKNILIVGGGSGQMLNHFNGKQVIHFVDSSSTMIRKARNRQTLCEVHFYHKTFSNFVTTERFDSIHFPFFLDQFNDMELGAILSKSYELLKTTGQLIISDFTPIAEQRHIYQKLLLRTVIVFFTITTRHPVSKIFNIQQIALASHFKLVKKIYFNKGMVFASVWNKAEH